MFLLLVLLVALDGSIAQLRGSVANAKAPKLAVFQGKNQKQTVTRLALPKSTAAGPVHCLCKGRDDKYYCAESYEGFAKCDPVCGSACSRTRGHKFMCGDSDEIIWLGRYFKGEEGDMTCKLDKGQK